MNKLEEELCHYWGLTEECRRCPDPYNYFISCVEYKAKGLNTRKATLYYENRYNMRKM